MKIVFFGDSITEGCFELSFHNAEGATDIIRDKKSVYHNVLKERIEKEHPGLDIEYVNAGISGNSSADAIKRMQVIYMAPNMYNTYVHGDVLPNHADMAAVLAGIQNENRPDLYYAEAKKRAEKYGCAVADAYRVWKKLSEYGVDTTELLSNRLNHPTRAMHRLFADLLYDEVVRLAEK